MNECNLNSGGSNMNTGDSKERKMDNQFHNKGGRRRSATKKRLLLYMQKGTIDYNF